MTVRWLGITVPEAYPPTKSLADIVPSVRPKMEQLISKATALGMKPSIRSAGRTCAQQNEQKQLGYSQASMCRSMHTIGHAIDLDLSPSNCATYTKLGEWWEQQGGVWGGRWTQFGSCGDAGHFHYGLGKTQAVPTSICPDDVSLIECQQLREKYLRREFSRGGLSTGGGLLTGALIMLVGFGFVWATLRVKPGLRENPLSKALHRRLVELAEKGAWAKSMAQRELDLFDQLVEMGYARREWVENNFTSWVRYHITPAGRSAAMR